MVVSLVSEVLSRMSLSMLNSIDIAYQDHSDSFVVNDTVGVVLFYIIYIFICANWFLIEPVSTKNPLLLTHDYGNSRRKKKSLPSEKTKYAK